MKALQSLLNFYKSLTRISSEEISLSPAEDYRELCRVYTSNHPISHRKKQLVDYLRNF